MHSTQLTLISASSDNQFVVALSRDGYIHYLLVPKPDPRLNQLRSVWFRQFQALHDLKPDQQRPVPVTREAVRKKGERLLEEMQRWLHQPAWAEFHNLLESHPHEELRICFDKLLDESMDLDALEELPWEACFPTRTVLRVTRSQHSTSTPRRTPARKPRVLLLIGKTLGLSIEQEKQVLISLQRQGRINLEILEGDRSRLQHLKQLMADSRGWDVFLFVGHSQANLEGGDGILDFADGSQHRGGEVLDALRPAIQRGLHLVILNSCQGSQIAGTFIQGGVDWVHCFLDRVPDHIAAECFLDLWRHLENGETLTQAAGRIRAELRDQQSTCDLLTAIYCTPKVRTFLLPLRKGKQFLVRLRHTQIPQIVAAGLTPLLAAWIAIDPVNPIQRRLLDQRLLLQQWWRHVRQVPGPTATPIAVMLLGDEAFLPSVGSLDSLRVSRSHLARLIDAVPADRPATVGLDFVLDAPEPGSDQLAATIRQRRDLRVFAGFYGGDCVAAANPGENSQLLPELARSGVEAGNLSIQIPQPRDPSLKGMDAQCGSTPTGLRVQPLQLAHPLTGDHFAPLVAGVQSPVLPAHSIIDWSLNWFATNPAEGGKGQPLIIRVRTLDELSQIPPRALLIGRGFGEKKDDLFMAPQAWKQTMADIWGGSRGHMPGVLIQAALVQSLRMGHWLRPLPLYPIPEVVLVALSASGGVALAAAIAQPRLRLTLLLAITAFCTGLALELALRQRVVVPLAFPLTALWTTALLRRERPDARGALR